MVRVREEGFICPSRERVKVSHVIVEFSVIDYHPKTISFYLSDPN